MLSERGVTGKGVCRFRASPQRLFPTRIAEVARRKAVGSILRGKLDGCAPCGGVVANSTRHCAKPIHSGGSERHAMSTIIVPTVNSIAMNIRRPVQMWQRFLSLLKIACGKVSALRAMLRSAALQNLLVCPPRTLMIDNNRRSCLEGNPNRERGTSRENNNWPCKE